MLERAGAVLELESEWFEVGLGVAVAAGLGSGVGVDLLTRNLKSFKSQTTRVRGFYSDKIGRLDFKVW